jgi:hypothetical protein
MVALPTEESMVTGKADASPGEVFAPEDAWGEDPPESLEQPASARHSATAAAGMMRPIRILIR